METNKEKEVLGVKYQKTMKNGTIKYRTTGNVVGEDAHVICTKAILEKAGYTLVNEV